MQVKAETVIRWIDFNLPPLSWRIIAVKHMRLLLTNNISTSDINSSTYFNEEILATLKECVKQDYNKDLPSFD